MRIREIWQQRFIDELHRRNEETQNEIDRIDAIGLRFGERLSDGVWSDVTDREIGLLKQDIASRHRTIARLEEEISGGPGIE
jgi:hypothetical protein